MPLNAGGEAALIGGGGSILGVGTDVGGSVRLVFRTFVLIFSCV